MLCQHPTHQLLMLSASLRIVSRSTRSPIQVGRVCHPSLAYPGCFAVLFQAHIGSGGFRFMYPITLRLHPTCLLAAQHLPTTSEINRTRFCVSDEGKLRCSGTALCWYTHHLINNLPLSGSTVVPLPSLLGPKATSPRSQPTTPMLPIPEQRRSAYIDQNDVHNAR
jgi:hypothetical protein